MTLSTTINVVRYAAGAGQTLFPYPFRVDEGSHLEVYRNGALLASGYGVSGLGQAAGGNVTLEAGAAEGDNITLRRRVPLIQALDLPIQGALNTETLESAGLDRGVMIDQQQEEELGRTFKAPVESSVSDLTLTPAAGRLIGWNAGGDALVNYAPDGATSSPATAFAAGLLDDADAAEARATLGLDALFDGTHLLAPADPVAGGQVGDRAFNDTRYGRLDAGNVWSGGNQVLASGNLQLSSTVADEAELRADGGVQADVRAAPAYSALPAGQAALLRGETDGAQLVHLRHESGGSSVSNSLIQGGFGPSNGRAVMLEAEHAAWSGEQIVANMLRPASGAATFIACHSGNFGDREFAVGGDGNVYLDGGTSSPADYAELYENGRPGVLPPGTVVWNFEGKVYDSAHRPEGARLLGVVRPPGASSLVGNSDHKHWRGKYLRDAFRRPLWERVRTLSWQDDAGRRHSHEADRLPAGLDVPADATVATIRRKARNPAFDENRVHDARLKRPSAWSIVGLLGQVEVRDGEPVAREWIRHGPAEDDSGRPTGLTRYTIGVPGYTL